VAETRSKTVEEISGSHQGKARRVRAPNGGKKVASVKTPVKPYNRTEHDGKKSGGTVKIKWVSALSAAR